jgi:hypothetical protein
MVKAEEQLTITELAGKPAGDSPSSHNPGRLGLANFASLLAFFPCSTDKEIH